MLNKIRLVCFQFIIFTLSLYGSQVDLFAQSATTDSGVKLIKNEKFTEAKKYFNSLLNGKLKPEAYFYLGQIYFLQEKLDSAKASYLKGIEADKDFPLNYAGLVKIYAAGKNNSLADKNQEEAIDLDDKSPEVYIVLSEAYSNPKVKNYDKAIELLNSGLKINPKFAATYIALGKAYLEKNKGTEAANNFQNAIDIDGTNAEALTLKAKIYILVDNNKEAISLLNEAIKNDPSYSPAYNELAELNYTMRDYAKAAEYYNLYMETSEVNLEKKKRYASMLYLNKEYQKAIDILVKVIQAEPGNPVPVRILAYSYLKLEDSENSISYFKKLFEMPSVEYLPTDYENYADLLSQTGSDSLAIEFLSKIVELDSTRKDILGKMSVLCYKNKNWNCVISSLEKREELTGQELFDLGKAYYFVKDSLMADTTFARLIEAKPDLAIAYHWRGRINSMFDPETELGLAKPFYEQFITLSKEDTTKFKKELIEAYSYLGYYFFLQDDKEISLINWEKVAALDPENEQAKVAIEELNKLMN